jgi:predicted nucleic-acid-binding protein
LIGLDTNVLVRYITQDDAEQFKLAERFIETQLSAQQPGFINQIALCELVWVFESIYKFSRDNIAATLQRVLETNVFVIERSDLAWQALAHYRGNHDFADALITLTNAAYECKRTVTFDKNAGRLSGMTLIGRQ